MLINSASYVPAAEFIASGGFNTSTVWTSPLAQVSLGYLVRASGGPEGDKGSEHPIESERLGALSIVINRQRSLL